MADGFDLRAQRMTPEGECGKHVIASVHYRRRQRRKLDDRPLTTRNRKRQQYYRTYTLCT